ncbi:hypothetical protein [Ralstonia mannitolilytica]|nr:hypothetical protein [Ralstonia mannitolilytica]
MNIIPHQALALTMAAVLAMPRGECRRDIHHAACNKPAASVA